MKIETRLKLDLFKPRNYQLPIFEAIEDKKYKKVIAIMPRRSGKDITAWHLAIRQCLRKPCMVFYVLPTYSQAKKTIWDAISIDGTKFIDFIPSELIVSSNSQEMKIRFINGSLLQCIGGDSYNTSLVGSNPSAIIFSEYALMDSNAYTYARPILAANDGWALFLSTPRGRNHLWELWNIALQLPNDWFTYKLTLDDTQHIPEEIINKEKSQMSPEMFLQEWYCSFDRGVEGSYYGRFIDKLKINNQIGIVPWEPGLKVHTAWDLGVHDATCIIFFQSINNGQMVRIIDCYSNTGVGLDHYVKVIQNKSYIYGKHFAPHDIKVREWAAGAVTRFDKARQLGINFTLVPDIGLEDGIECVWGTFNKLYIDESKCLSLLNALENYRREWDEQKQRHKDKPIHNWASNYADALRYLCIALPKSFDGTTAAQLEQRYNEAMGYNSNIPAFFRDDLT